MRARVGTEERELAELTGALEGLGVGEARFALVLGSGLGALTERLDEARRVRYEELPGMPASSVPGHAGELVLGRLAGVPVVAQRGRVHLYEGRSAREVTRCVRALAACGVGRLLLTNAAGGTRPEWELPALMRITDHVNHQGRAPLARAEAGAGSVYDEALGEALDRAAAERGLTLHHGVYHAVLGPSYETPAEVRMMAEAGAGAIGMSTVQEAMVARAAGMRVAAVSAITNPGAGISETPLSHDEVVEAGEVLSGRFCDLVEAFVGRA